MQVTFANYIAELDDTFVKTFPGIQADSSNICILGNTLVLTKEIFARHNKTLRCSFDELLTIKRLTSHWGCDAESNETFLHYVEANKHFTANVSARWLWQIHVEIPTLVDWVRIFRRITPTRTMNLLLSAHNDFETQIQIKRFFHNIDFSHIFDENNDDTAAEVDRYNKDRAKNIDSYMASIPLSITDDIPALSHYRVYNGETLKCEKMTRQQRVPIGTPTMSDPRTAANRFHSYTNELFAKSPNPNLAGMNFNWENVCVAGGSALKLITPWTTTAELRASDIDVFVSGKSFHERSSAFKRTVEWFNGPNVYFAVQSSVVTVFFKNIPRKIQIISISEKSPADVINRFDFSHVSVAFTGNGWIMTPAAWDSICTQTTVLGNVHRWNPNRMYKAMVNGYDVAINEALLSRQLDFTEILEISAERVTELVSDSCVWYYPRDEPEMTPEEEIAYHLSCIKKDTRAQAVGKTVDIVFKNVLIGGSFDSDYAAMSFANFNISSVLTKVASKQTGYIILSTAGGVVRLLSCDCTVEAATENDDGFSVVLSYKDEAFTKFVENIEGPVYKLYRNRSVYQSLLTGMKFTSTMPARLVANAKNKGVAIARTQRGEGVDISEITVGDTIQMMFNIKFVLSGNCCVELVPIRFIKITEYQPEQFEEVEPTEIDDEAVEGNPNDGEIDW